MMLTIPMAIISKAADAFSFIIAIYQLSNFFYLTPLFSCSIQFYPNNGTKASINPPATTEPICPPTLALTACINK